MKKKSGAGGSATGATGTTLSYLLPIICAIFIALLFVVFVGSNLKLKTTRV